MALATVAAVAAVIGTEVVRRAWPGAPPVDTNVISALVVFFVVLTFADRERLRAALTARRFEHALERGAVSVHFQPVVELRGDRVIGAEALVRWTDRRRGPISPERFVGQLEGKRAERSLTEFVLDRAVAELASWQEAGHDLRVAVNVSPAQLGDDLEAMIVRTLERHGQPPEALVIELTEGDVDDDDVGRYSAAVGRLGAMGVRVALDDFGRASSSLVRLSLLAVNALKVDRSFVAELDRRVDGEVLRHTISLAHTLGMRVVAEGVETEHQWRQLKVWGCDLVQGYLISRPLPADRFADWLEVAGPRTMAALSDSIAPAPARPPAPESTSDVRPGRGGAAAEES